MILDIEKNRAIAKHINAKLSDVFYQDQRAVDPVDRHLSACLLSRIFSQTMARLRLLFSRERTHFARNIDSMTLP